MIERIPKKNVCKFVIVFFLGIICSGMFAGNVSAATLSLTSNSNSVSVGNIFQTSVLVNTQGKSINNSEGIIQFPIDLLEVVSVSKSPSVFSLWVEEPNYSNYSGQITYNGGVPNPGFIGTGGSIATITFRAKKAGVASVIFSDAAVRENDGLGTDILNSKGNLVINIGGVEQEQAPEIVSIKNTLPPKPVVISDTHPNEDEWYSGTSASFGWKIPADVTSVQANLNKTAIAVPYVTYDNSVSQKTLNNLTDGVWYFHIRYANSQGSGPIEHYKVQVDSTAPQPFVPVISTEGYKSLVSLNAKDVTSGIAYYTIKIDSAPEIKVKNSEVVDGRFELPLQAQGDHNMVVVAYDKAKNHTEARVSFVSSAISAPKFSFEKEQVKQDETVSIIGKTEYPGVDVEFFVESGGKELLVYKKKTSDDGTFKIVTDKIKYSGLLSVWGQVSLSDTIKGEKSDKQYLTVSGLDTKEWLAKVMEILLIVFPILILLVLMWFIVYLGWHKFFGLKRKINREADETISDVHKIMSALKEELSIRLIELEKIKVEKKLNKKEQEIFRSIEDSIDDIDKFIEKKINKSKS